MEDYRYFPGNLPVIISIPHAGTALPPAIAGRLTDAAKTLPDTDWHVDLLYDFARAMGVHMLVATWSRYVVDVNRGKDDASLYPGKFTTGLCPLTRFDATPLYREGRAPDAAEVAQRVVQYWEPYHRQLRATIDMLRAKHGRAVLLEAHSIASVVPTLFEGHLPDLNFGTADGASADPRLAEALLEVAGKSPYSAVLNGRFKGGYITRHYGDPARNIHAVQLELAQHNYMEEAHPYKYDEQKAAALQTLLRAVVEKLITDQEAYPT